MRARAQELPSRRSKVTGAPGGESRPRAKRNAPGGNTGALATEMFTGVLAAR